MSTKNKKKRELAIMPLIRGPLKNYKKLMSRPEKTVLNLWITAQLCMKKVANKKVDLLPHLPNEIWLVILAHCRTRYVPAMQFLREYRASAEMSNKHMDARTKYFKDLKRYAKQDGRNPLELKKQHRSRPRKRLTVLRLMNS